MTDTWEQQCLVAEWLTHITLRTPHTKIELAPWDGSQRDYHMGVVLRITRSHPATPEEDSRAYGLNQAVPPFIDDPAHFVDWLEYTLIRFEADLIRKHYLLVDGKPIR